MSVTPAELLVHLPFHPRESSLRSSRHLPSHVLFSCVPVLLPSPLPVPRDSSRNQYPSPFLHPRSLTSRLPSPPVPSRQSPVWLHHVVENPGQDTSGVDLVETQEQLLDPQVSRTVLDDQQLV